MNLPKNAKNLAGHRYGRLVATKYAGRASCGKLNWQCVCDCGSETVVISSNLTSGKTRSCGCLHKDVIQSIHGNPDRKRNEWLSLPKIIVRGRKINPTPPLDVLRDRFVYDPETGDITWRKAIRAGSAEVGTIASFDVGDGRLNVSLNPYGQFAAARIAWKMMMGEDADGYVDHIDGNPNNNRWLNLRLATPSENARNRKVSVRSTTGYMGVIKTKDGKFIATIRLGTFDTADEAHAEYRRAAKIFHGDFASKRTIAADNDNDEAGERAA